MRKEILKKSLKKIVAMLLVLTLIFGTGYSSYAKNTSIHLDTKAFPQLKSMSIFVVIDVSGTIHKLPMSLPGNSSNFTTPDLGLLADPIILHFEIGGIKYLIGQQVIKTSNEAGGTMNYDVISLPNYKVTYDVNSGTGDVPAPPTNYQPYTTVNVLGNTNNITKADHMFTGWNTAANGSGTSYVAGNSFVMGFADVTLYAQWAPLYNVYYNGNGNDGGTAPTDIKEYKPGDTATVATKGTLTKTGLTFAGWSTTNDGNGTDYMPSSQLTIANADVTLYAQWTKILPYTVTYDKNAENAVGDVPVDGTSYYSGDSVTVLGSDIVNPILTRPEFNFIGWSTSTDGSSGILGTAFKMASSNVTLYAQWAPIGPVETKYKITYHGNTATSGSVPVDDTEYSTGSKTYVLGNTGALALVGHNFNAWNTSANGTGTSYADGSQITIGTYNITLYAQWTPFYLVNYDGNGNTGGTAPTDAIEYFSGDEVTVKPVGDLIKIHYTFDGWNTQANGLGTTYTSTFNIGNSDQTLYAKWIPDPTYNVIYSMNGATSGSVPVDSTEYFTGDNPVVLGNSGSLALTGYSFNGWNTIANGSGTAYNASNTLTMGTTDIILYAQWSLTPPPPPQETTGTTSAPTTEGPTAAPTTAAPTTEGPTATPTTSEPTTEEPATASTTASTEESTEELTEELIPEGAAIIVNFDEPLDSSTFEEVIELGTEAIPLAPALPQTGQLPVELFYGIGGLITAAGVFLRKNK